MTSLNSKSRSFDELEDLGLLDDAIASASQRRSICANQDDSLPKLLAEEINSVIGGLPTIVVFDPPITIGLVANDFLG